MNRLKKFRIYTSLLVGLFFLFATASHAALLMHLPFDGNLNDISGNGNHGSFPGGSRNPGFTSAVFNQGINFDGNNDYITVPSFNPGSTFSASLWVNHDNIGTLNTFIEHVQNGNNRNDFYIGYDNSNNQLTVELEDNNSTEGGACGNPKFCTGISLKANRWYHVVVTVTPTTLKVYIDANLAYSVTHSTTVNFSSGSWLLGGDTDNNPVTTANSDYLDGRIDDVHIFNHELSTTEVSQLYGLTGFWKFDDCSVKDSASISDASGYNNTATAYGGVSSTTGKICTAGLFNGTSGYVKIPHAANLNGSSALTYSAWIKPNSWSGGIRQIMAKSVHGGGSGRSQMGIFSEGGVLKGRAETTGGQREVSMALPSVGSWHHVALVFTASSLTLYIDGTSTTTNFTSTTLKPTNDELDISKRVGTSQYFFDGAIDEVKVFNRALIADEITGYNANPNPINRTCPVCGSTPATGCASDYGVYSLGNMDISGTVSINGNTVANYDGSTNDGINPSTGALVDVTPAPTLPDINPSTFPANSSNRDLFNPATVRGAPSDPATPSGYYDDITVNSTTTFTGGTYHIDRLTVGNGDTINLAPGNYFIDNLRMGTNSNLVITPAGKVNIFIGTDVSTGNNVDLNAGGTASNLIISLYSNVDFELDNNGALSGFVYSPYSNVDLDFDAGVSITGAVITNGDVDFDNGTTITYGAAEQAAAATLVQCAASSLHHVEFIHDGSALTCNPEAITVKTCANADCSTLATSIDVNLSPANASSTAITWSDTDSKTFATGTENLTLQNTNTGIITLGTVSTSPAATNPVVCKNLSGAVSSCDINYNDSGFIYNIGTQTSCETSPNVTISAVRKSPTTEQCVPFFNGKAAALKFWTGYSNPASGTKQATLNYNGTDYPLSTTAPGTDITMTFDSNGQSRFTLTYPDAGQLNLNTSYTGSAATSDDGLSMAGNQTYVTKPAKLYVYSDDVNADCATNDATCSAFTSAGSSFNLKVRAACADNTKTPNFVLNNISVSHNNTAPAIAQGSLGVSSFNMIAADQGEHIISNQTVSEVGVFTFTATSPNYLGVTGPAGTSTYIGRFHPHHFETLVTHGCSNTFTYSGQPFQVTAYARNLANSTTVNYRDAFAYTGVTLSDANPASPALGTFFNNTISETSFSSNTADNGSNFGVGTQPIDPKISYQFITKDTIPETLEIRATENKDGVTSNGFAEGTTEIRSGRARLENVFGSELTALTMPLKIEYYSDNSTPADLTDDGFIINTDDNCTNYDATSGALTNYTGNLSTAETTVTGAGLVSSGQANIMFSAPGSGNEGSVNLLANNISPWLTYNWNVDCDNADADNDITTGIDAGLCGPYGTASFGFYRGDDRVIYWREVF